MGFYAKRAIRDNWTPFCPGNALNSRRVPQIEIPPGYKSIGLLQRRYEEKLARNRYLRLEIRRRIAEAFVNEAILHQCPYSTCQAAFSKLFVLGFSTNELKWHYCLLYARVALQHGHRRTAYRIADSTHNELSKWLKFHHSSAGKELLDLIRVFMQKLSRV